MAKLRNEAEFTQQLSRAFEAFDFYDALLSRVQAIEDILINAGLTSRGKLRRNAETKQKKISAKRRDEAVALLKEISNEKHRRLRKLLDKASGPLQ